MQLVDWDMATATATRLAPPGPRIELADAVATVEELRRTAAEAERHVAAYTGLPSRDDGVGIVAVDRPAALRPNVAGFRHLVGPLRASVLGSRGCSIGPFMGAIGPRAAALEVGALL